MESPAHETDAVTCDYCGRANPADVPACSGCGSPLVEDNRPKPKSLKTAVGLALAFGPLGLCYASVRAGIVVLAVEAAILLIVPWDFWFALSSRILCITMAYSIVRAAKHGGSKSFRMRRLLAAAARLESVDRARAIVVYQQIVKLFPNTSASKEAERNVETLRGHQYSK
jgi:hypothetical protein